MKKLLSAIIAAAVIITALPAHALDVGDIREILANHRNAHTLSSRRDNYDEHFIIPEITDTPEPVGVLEKLGHLAKQQALERENDASADTSATTRGAIPVSVLVCLDTQTINFKISSMVVGAMIPLEFVVTGPPHVVFYTPFVNNRRLPARSQSGIAFNRENGYIAAGLVVSGAVSPGIVMAQEFEGATAANFRDINITAYGNTVLTCIVYAVSRDEWDWDWATEVVPLYRPGDVTGTGNIEIGDVLEILKYLAGLPNILENNANAFNAALITGADVPVIEDALEILKYLANLPSLVR
jgi:hypothetical protein